MMATLTLTDYQVNLLYHQLSALADAAAEVLDREEQEALDEIISNLLKLRSRKS